jgi:flagellar biosynthesis/type III secretory pathway M-ring protein FliF/YscJ
MPGKILSVSVAAFVDLSPPEVPAAEEGEAPAAPAPTPAPALTTQDVEDVIRRAIGLRETDELKVVSCTFHRPAAMAEAGETDFLADPGFYLDAARHASLGLLVVGALLALKMFGGSRRKAGAGGGALAAGGAGEPAAIAARQRTGSGLLPPGALDFENADPNELNDRITTALKENPDEVKRLFRTWVEQQQGAA